MTGKIIKKQHRKGLLERRGRILEAAAEVFAEKGFEGATVDDIAGRAGVGKGTIYRRIGKKEDFTNLLIQNAVETIIDAIALETKKRTDPLLQFKEAIYALCDVYEKNISLMMLIMSRLSLNIKDKIKKSPATKKEVFPLFNIMEDILNRAVKKKQIRPADTHAVVKGLFHFLNPYFYRYLRIKCNYARGEIAQFTIDLFLNGLRIRK